MVQPAQLPADLTPPFAEPRGQLPPFYTQHADRSTDHNQAGVSEGVAPLRRSSQHAVRRASV